MRDGTGCRALNEDAARELVRGTKSKDAHDEDDLVVESSGHPSVPSLVASCPNLSRLRKVPVPSDGRY